MAIINSYPTNASPTESDLLIGTDVSTTPPSTKSFTIKSLGSLLNPTAPATGTGTANTVPLWTGVNTLGDSLLVYNPGSNKFTTTAAFGTTNTAGISTTDLEATANVNFGGASVVSMLGSVTIGNASLDTLSIVSTTTITGPVRDTAGTLGSANQILVSGGSGNLTFAAGDLAATLGRGNTTTGSDIRVSAGDDITFSDTSKALFGAGNDLQVYHDGSNSYIADTGTGDLIISSNLMKFQSDTGEQMARMEVNAAVTLSYDNVTKFATTTNGVSVTGNALISTISNSAVDTDKFLVDDGGEVKYRTGAQLAADIGAITGGPFLPLAGGTMAGDIILPDNIKLEVGSGTGGDLQIYHNGSDSYIDDQGTGNLIVRGSTNILISTSSGGQMAQFTDSGSAFLYHSGNLRLSTTSAGATITGNLTATGDLTASGGDLSLTGSGTVKADTNLQLNANSGSLRLQEGGNTKLSVTATRVNISTAVIANHANNAAALAAGLVAGDLYRNGDSLNIVH
tara:strand:- start:288 stop:1820 length:1533 start_codon:yes stop_codon:yes gene_type:complete